MDRALLKKSIDEWRTTYLLARSGLVQRKTEKLPSKDIAAAIIGVRRSGKTYQAIQMTCELPAESVFYYNFEDPLFYLDNSVQNLDLLLSVAIEHNSSDFEVLVLDEIHNIAGWERWVRKIVDQKQYRLIITGSSAKMLSSEIATSIAGRCIEYVTWPLSFSEYLTFKKISPHTLPQKLGALRDYLQLGAFPAVALTPGVHEKKQILKQYLNDIVLKDVISRNQIRNVQVLDQIIYYYLTNISSLHSYSALKNAFAIGVDTAAEYTSALQDAFFVFEVSRYHKNLKVQNRDPKKIYAIDTGLRNINSRSAEPDYGKLLENIVYLELRRRGQQAYYFKDKFEADFIITENYKPVAALQVCAASLSEPTTRTREIRALEEAMSQLHLKEGTIVTLDHTENIRGDSGSLIRCIPAVDWLLSS